MAEKITIINSSEDHPINPSLKLWAAQQEETRNINIVRKSEDAMGGDICFLVSCEEIIDKAIRERYTYVLAIHASDLPIGRGWSPHIWAIINGADSITVSLLEAAEKVDQGKIWKKNHYKIGKSFLYKQILEIINQAHIDLMDFALKNYETIISHDQNADIEPTYFPRRTPDDSEVSPYIPIADQFNLLRVCDKNRFPAFFKLHGKKYKIVIEDYVDE